MEKKNEKLMKIDFNTRPTYGDDDDNDDDDDDDKYINTRIKTYKDSITTNSDSDGDNDIDIDSEE